MSESIQTEQLPHAEGFIRSEANGKRSRENVTLLSGEDLVAGTVLGVVTASGKYAQVDPEASNGLETAKAVLLRDSDATDGDLEVAVLARDAEVQKDDLTYSTGATAQQKSDFDADLKDVGIIVRSGPSTVETQTT